VQPILPHLFRYQTERAGGSRAITHLQRSASRSDLSTRVDTMRDELSGAAVEAPGAVLGIVCESPLEVFAALHASSTLGIGAVLCDPAWGDSHRLAALDRIGATHVLTSDASGVYEIETRANVPTAGRHSVHAGEIVFFTAGTTGVPSAIIHSDRSIAAALWLLVASSDATAARSQGQLAHNELVHFITTSPSEAFESGPVLVSCLPPWTHAGFTMMNYACLTGAHLVVAWPFDPSDTLDAIAEFGASSVGLSPFMARLLVRAQRRLQRDVASLVVVGLGAGPVSPQLATAIENTFACCISIGYGLTETGGAVSRSRWSDPVDERTSTVGHPLPGVELRIEPTEGLDVAGGGELVVKTPAVMEAQIGADGSRDVINRTAWFPTGDLARATPAGSLQILGRLTDVIIRGGRNIDPKRVEDILSTHPSVSDCAVIGLASRIEGEQEVWAAVLPASGSWPNATELADHCHAVLADYEVPTRFRILHELPRTTDGAVQRFRLAEILLGSESNVERSRQRSVRP
jgi:acyl-CoA synthetase (AMP-forming)/AMP-acid ligase II